MDDRFTIEFSRKWLRRAVVVLASAMLVLPAVAWAGHQFDDVPSTDKFHGDITWMKDNGITRGCNPPANDEYCPDRELSREEMAAFLHRMDTEDVFLRPEEADAMTHFAVINENGSASASNGLASSDDTAVGTYVLDFGTDISECSWTGAVGDRDGATVQNATVTLSADGADSGVIHALVTDGDGTLIDEDFNVTVTC